jgi:predicted RNase H-like nuclease (RuvC/YqgF family)
MLVMWSTSLDASGEAREARAAEATAIMEKTMSSLESFKSTVAELKNKVSDLKQDVNNLKNELSTLKKDKPTKEKGDQKERECTAILWQDRPHGVVLP